MQRLPIAFRHAAFSVGLLFVALTATAAAANITFPGYPLATDPYGFTGSLFPGSSLSGNTVTITSGSIGGFVEGGVTNDAADVTNNSVTINYVDSVTYSVFGGKTNGGNAVGNVLTIHSGTITGEAAAGFSFSGGVSNNQITIYGGSIGGGVYGGQGIAFGEVANNRVTIQGGSIGSVWGGNSERGNSRDNTVVITGGTISDSVAGGVSFSVFGTGNITGNSVVFSGTASSQYVYGGWMDGTGIVSGNSVTIADNATTAVIYGGYAGNGISTANTITVTGGNIYFGVFGGYASLTKSTSGNQVRISGGTIGSQVIGGTAGGDAVDNSVVVTGGTMNGFVYGGQSRSSGITAGNSVHFTGGTAAGNVYGGLSNQGTSTNNTVTVEDGRIGGSVRGGMSAGAGEVGENAVTITGGVLAQAIYGGYAAAGAASANTVTISKTDAPLVLDQSEINGGYSGGSGDVLGNTVAITGLTGLKTRSIRGGLGTNGSVTGNSVSIADSSGLEIDGLVAGGGAAAGGSASGNSVIITESANFRVSGDILGGFSQAGDGINGNTVTILDADGFQAANIIGGQAAGGSDAIGNTVAITNAPGLRVDGDIMGGAATGGSPANRADNNSVIFTDVPGLASPLGNIVGGYAPGGASSSGNQVAFYNSPNFSVGLVSGGESAAADPWRDNTFTAVLSGGQAREIRNFQKYTFFLPNSLGNGQTLIAITGGTPTDMTNAAVAITGIEGGGTYLRPGEYVNLIGNATGTPASVAATQVPKGFALLYDFDVSTAGGSLRASLKDDTLNPGGNVVPDGPIAEIVILSHYAELIDGLAAVRLPEPQERRKGPSVYARATGGTYRYNAKSNIDVDGGSLLAGMDWRIGNLVLGGFFETGHGNYDSTRYFASLPDVKTHGSITYYGGGVLGFLALPADFYAEASARAGGVDTRFRSDTIHFINRRVEYDLSHAYYGAHAGLGHLFDFGGGSGLDVYAKYFWVRQAGDNVTIMGDRLDIDPADSQRCRLGARYAHAFTPRLTGIAGAAFEYEFDGAVVGRVDRYTLEASGVRGGIGIGEIGLAYRTNRGFSMEVNAKGFVGKREGVLGRVQFGFDF